MKEKKKIWIGILFLVCLAAAVYMDFFQSDDEGTVLLRNSIGQGDKEQEYLLSAENILEEYPYQVVIQEAKYTKEEAGQILNQAKEEIDESFCREGEALSKVTGYVRAGSSYAKGSVQADWSFSDYDAIDVDGTLAEEGLSEEGTVILATALLSCGDYQEEYTFPFVAFPTEKTSKELLLEKIDGYFAQQNEQEGEGAISLPAEIDGVSLQWTSAKEYLTCKVLLVELVVLLLFPLIRIEQAQQRRKEREKELCLEYPEMVSKLAVLTGSGMTIKQSWNKISASYFDKRQKNQTERKEVYEQMYKTARELEEGKSERQAYREFGERIALPPYYRLVRILIQSLQKGSKGMLEMLEQESEAAFEERKHIAKKLGEEASTKMIFPLILMMGIVMAIVIVPSIVDFIM